MKSESTPSDVVDTIGGDSFNDGILSGAFRGWSLPPCLQLGLACGSRSTRPAGGTAAEPKLDEPLAAVEVAT